MKFPRNFETTAPVGIWTDVRALIISVLLLGLSALPARLTAAELQNVAVQGGVSEGKAHLIIEGNLFGGPEKEKPIFSTAISQIGTVERTRVTHDIIAGFDVIQGVPAEFALTLNGQGEIKQVTGSTLQDWSVRQETNGTRRLVLRTRKQDKPAAHHEFHITAEHGLKSLDDVYHLLSLASADPALLSGHLLVQARNDLQITADAPSGLYPIDTKYLPGPMRAVATNSTPAPLAFRFQGAPYSLGLGISQADPDAGRIALRNFRLDGKISDDGGAFTLTAQARVTNPKGASIELLSGNAALTQLPQQTDWKIEFENGKYVLKTEKAGVFPVEIHFNAGIRPRGDASQGWNTLDFRVSPAALAPISLEGLPADTQFEFPGAAQPERKNGAFQSYLPVDGRVNLSWKKSATETGPKLFFSAEMLAQVSVGAGLMRQSAVLQVKVMQGALNQLVLVVHGQGEVARVQGEHVLAWNIEPVPNADFRRLTIHLNESQKDQFTIQLQLQTPLGAFPQSFDAVRLQPEGATRFAGFIRVVNDGAVRLEATQSAGISQISPEQFPETDLTKSTLPPTGNQKFVYRFSTADFGLRIQAAQIVPELAVSEVLVYRLGENDLAIEVEVELDVREAPLRELLLRVPKGYGIARLNASGLSDYFVHDTPDAALSELRLVYGQPVTGRQLIQLRLEQNQALGGAAWALPRVEVVKAKSVRGQLGIAADPGYRLTPELTRGLTEVATAFFPRKEPGLQSAFRLSDPEWQATLRVERLPQTVQADAMHLFSIGEGIAYGSSVLNYTISGAPISTFRLELSEEYFNVEVTGKDIRNWQKVNRGYVVQLHTPVSGPYTLLVTYERPFKAQGETLTFTGARPLDAASEQGHTLIVSAGQFQVQPVEVSPGLLQLEPGEVPSEYRLFFDAPLLAAYRYNARPFNLRLSLSPLTQGGSLSQVVDRVMLNTRISKEGQVLTEARLFVKNRGTPNLRVTLPAGTELWSATVNGLSVVPVKDTNSNLIPLPQRQDANSVLSVELKLASRSSRANRVTVGAPRVDAPVLMAEWKLSPDAGQRLVFKKGSLKPLQTDLTSGFSQLVAAFSAPNSERAWSFLIVGFFTAWLGILLWRWAAHQGGFRFSLRHIAGMLCGLVAIILSAVAFFALADLVNDQRITLSPELTFLAPIQQAAAPSTVEVANVRTGITFGEFVSYSWPAVLAILLFIASRRFETPQFRTLTLLAGWALLAWSALRWPGGATAYFIVLAGFFLIHSVIPALTALWRLPRRVPTPQPPSAQPGGATTATALLIAAICLGFAQPSHAGTIAKSVRHDLTIEKDVAFGKATIEWQAAKGDVLPILYEPAVLTGAQFPSNAIQIARAPSGSKPGQVAVALDPGIYQIEVRYQVQLPKKDGENGFSLPIQHGLVNKARVTLVGLDMEVFSTQAVSIQRERSDSNTVASVVLSPVPEPFLGWRPRSRDVKGEKPVFYADIAQLYVPTAGVIEGAHHVLIRPAQGELSELVFSIPAGTTIIDVLETGAVTSAGQNRAQLNTAESLVSLWRFDPDERALRVTLRRSQSRPFSLTIRSQVPAGPPPFTRAIGLISVHDAAGQIGLLGIATGNELQLDDLSADAFSPINLEDFPTEPLRPLQAQVPGLATRRAFRYSDSRATASLTASAVAPDVRIETQDTVSLGEDRTVLAANQTVTITRAGIFRLSFVMPPNMDVETISGPALSHWTESRSETGRVVTLHLNGRTEGQQQFAVSLAGPGVKGTNNWLVPQVTIREASKQRGSLLIVPEQGLRLQVAPDRDGVTQLDPQKSGVRQKGVLAFRLLQSPWKLILNVEQVDPWIQATSLQHANLNEAVAKITANFQYQVENTGIKTLRVALPAAAETVRFSGDSLSDFMIVPNTLTNGWQAWEIKLQRRIIGSYRLQASFQILIPEQAGEFSLRGVVAEGVNLQRGFVTIQSTGRLQLRVDQLPESLQPAEWQNVPRSLRQDLEQAAAQFTYRLVEPAFLLPVKLERHEAARLLPARVNSVSLNSVIADNGVMLTSAKLEIIPGDKRSLHLTLPKDGRFWFAFVNQNGVWPWREQDRILIPLEQQSRGSQPMTLEFFYTSRVGEEARHSLDLNLLGPKFDLPLENITWRVSLGKRWKITSWSGSLQLASHQEGSDMAAVDLQAYLAREQTQIQQRGREAENLLAFGNSALEQGNPQQARRAFQAAYGLSTHDAAFNEDARVQLHNVKLQQALIGLNMRQLANDPTAPVAKLQDQRNNRDLNYTQKDAKDILDRNTADDNAAFMRVAERIVQQQDAAISNPNAIRVTLPEQGRILLFQRSVLVDPWADLRLHLAGASAHPARGLLILLATFLGLAIIIWTSRFVLFNGGSHRSPAR